MESSDNYSSESAKKDASTALSSKAAKQDLQESEGKDVSHEGGKGDTDTDDENEDEGNDLQLVSNNPHEQHINLSIKEPMGKCPVSIHMSEILVCCV